jgi:hypothetical protein
VVETWKYLVENVGLGEFSTFVGRKYGLYLFILNGHLSIINTEKVKGHEFRREFCDLLCKYEPLTLKAPSLIFYRTSETSIGQASIITLIHSNTTY